ncbi:MAG: FAD-binding protein [Sneathiella sp.]|nr:FAD-binding protein [Sneathiella sp.]
MEIFNITAEDQVLDLLQWALSNSKRLAIAGNDSKVALGRPMDVDATLSLSGLSGIEMYEPAELVMKAKAGTLVTLVEEELAASGQQLAFTPPDYGPLLGQPAGLGTLGGVFVPNLSGSSRIKAGAARDHLLGVNGFTGRGEAFQTGSRVMKNVTGYDLCKLVAGSYGTLAICTSLTFKVLPKSEKIRTVLVYGVTLEASVAIMRDALSSVHEVSAAAYMPAVIATKTGIDYLEGDAPAVALKIEGPAPSVEYRCTALLKLFEGQGHVEELHGHRSRALWKYLSDVRPFSENLKSNIWKISIPPSNAPAYVKAISSALSGLEYFLDWAGGLVWVSVPEGIENAGNTIIRKNLKGSGHATLIRASEQLRKEIPPFQPQNPVIAKISERIREGYDPQRILNPERMYPIVEI